MNPKKTQGNRISFTQKNDKDSCPICMIQGCSTKLDFEISGVWSKPINVYHCIICNLYFLIQKPDARELKDYYEEKYYFKSSLLDIIKSRFRLARSISQYTFFKEEVFQTINNVIEIGSGDGLLLSMFKNDNAKVYGIEYSKKYKNYAKNKYGISLINDDFFNIEGEYDLLIMSHVFEHFIDFNKVYKKVNQLLKNGGYFYIEVPNSPKPNEISTSELSSYLNSTHIHNFDKENLIKTIPPSFELITIQRFNYNIKTYLNHNKSLEISRSLLDSKLSKVVIFDTIINLFRILITPKKFYQKIDFHTSWQGYGDNIRMILRKNGIP